VNVASNEFHFLRLTQQVPAYTCQVLFCKLLFPAARERGLEWCFVAGKAMSTLMCTAAA